MSEIWRQFQLFDLTPIRDPNYQSNDPLYSDATLSAICSSQNHLIISTNSVWIKLISKDFQLTKSFIAYELEYRINYMKCLPNSNLLITVAERHGFPSLLKLWDLTKIISKQKDADEDYSHDYHSLCKISNGENSFPITAVEFNKNLTCIAVGYANGAVVLIRGDFIRDRGSKQRVIYESNEPITGIRFNHDESLLYLTTTSRILTVLTNGRNNGKLNRLLSKKTGVDLNCSTVDNVSGELIVATQDSIRYYNSTNKTNTILLEMPKKYVYRFGENYLLIVSPQEEEQGNNGKLLSKIIILDLLNKHISFSLTVPNNTINYVFEMWNDLYMLSSDGIIFKIHEKSINQQIEIILQRNLFTIAYKLALQYKLGNDMLIRISKLHGLHLFEKQEFKDSINEYINCLDLYLNAALMEDNLPDFIMDIITKFKDVSNINNLTKFLYRLYELKLSDNDHLTLLLCCYCKLRKLDELDNFIDALDLNDNNGGRVNFQELNFQLIINLFKECEYYPQVIKLLYKLNQPGHIVDIQLNYLNQPQKCLQYIKTLSIDDLLLILIEYSKTLLDNNPIDTTEILINVFTGSYVPKEANEPKVVEEDATLPLSFPSIPMNSYKNFLAYLSGNEEDASGSSPVHKTLSHVENGPTYLPPRPNLIFPSFINNPNEFVIFLEACIETFDKYQGNPQDKQELLMTLFEMYLSLSKAEPTNTSLWTERASSLLNTYSKSLDKLSLLLVSHLYNFDRGEISATEQSADGGFEESLFRSAAISRNVEASFTIAQKYGDSKPELYKLLLKFIISKEEIFDQVSESDFKSVLNKIKQYKLATPLEIIQILSTTNFTTIGLIKDYLIDYIDTQNKEISNNQKLIKSYELESTKIGNKLAEMTTKPFIIQNNKCSACGLKLDYPTIHFKCQHSYHQRCLEENTIIASSTILNNSTSTSSNKQHRDCPLCINDLEVIRETRKTQFNSKNNVQLFEQSLKDKDDRFKVITDFLGKGIMENENTIIL